MRILLTTIGSRGDVQPLLALAMGLRRRGHEVEFFAPENFTGWLADDHGFTTHPGIPDVQLILRQHPGSLRSTHRTLGLLAREMRAQIKAQLELLHSLVGRFDLVVASALQIAALSVCQAHGVEYRYLTYVPQLLPSREHPPFVLPFQRLPGWLNRGAHRIAEALLVKLIGAEIRHYRRQHQLQDARGIHSLVLGARPLICSSPTLSRPPHDANPGTLQTAQLDMETPEQVSLSEDLINFVQAGPPPLYVGFGSMVDDDPAQTSAMVVEAAVKTGTRVILSAGWSAAHHGPHPLVHHLTEAPHSVLLPLCAGAVHHGGAGTVHAVARADIPQIIVPHLMDQHYWGHVLKRIGVCPVVVPRRKLNQHTLATAMRALFETSEYTGRAVEIGSKIRDERGVDWTIAALEAGS